MLSFVKKNVIFLIGFVFGMLVTTILWIGIIYLWYRPYREYSVSHQTIQISSWNFFQWLADKIKKEILTLPIGGDSRWEKLDLVWTILKNQFVDPSMLHFDKMKEEAIKWFVWAIWDPFTVYLTKQENANFQKELKWTQDFEWIGAVVTKVEEWVMIEQVFKWYPAYKSGLRPLDIIIKINWEPTKDMSLAEAVSKIRWPAWTKVKLTIYRPSENKVFTIEVTREKVEIPSVTYEVKVLTWWVKIWYINISIIWQDTAQALKNALDDLKKQWVKGFILDLRWNGGWYLDVAVDIASHFIPSWKVIVQTKYRVFPDQVYKSYWYPDWQWYPIVVLVDGLTASAAEIISAALRDDIGAKLVGTKTFGKCTVQTMKEFDDWSSLKYTIWKRFTPKGFSVCSWWILPWKWLKPDVEVKFDMDLFKTKHIDNQLQKAEEVLYEMMKER